MSKVLVVTATWDGWIKKDLAEYRSRLEKDTRHECTFSYPRGRPYETALNMAVKQFLEGEWEWLLNIDADNIPTANLLDMIDHGKDICGSPYPIYQNKGTGKPIIWGVKCRERPSEKGLQRVDAIASGAMLVSRDVLAMMDKPIFRREYDSDGLQLTGVDYLFCYEAQKAGFEVWCDWDRRTLHWNEVELMETHIGYSRPPSPMPL